MQKIDVEAAEIYLGAIMTLKTDSSTTIKDEIEIRAKLASPRNPEKLPQAAHSIREALNKILREVDVPEKEERQRARIRKFADETTRLPESFYGVHDKLSELHNWFVAVSHHKLTFDEIEFNQKLDQFNTIILQILTPHYKAEDEIDQLLNIGQPTPEDLEKLLSKITNYPIYAYIFYNIESQWLKLLSKNENIFKNPPIVEITNDGAVFPTWPESKYLLKISPEKPSEVFDIISKCDVTNNGNNFNHRVLVDFIRIALTLPCEYSKRVGERIIHEKWRTLYPSSLGDEISKLIKKILDECNDVELSSRLTRFVLDVDLVGKKTPEKISQKWLESTMSYHYGQLLEETVPQIARKDPVATTQLLTEILRKSIYLYGKANYTYSNNDHSHFWYPAIDEHPNNRNVIEIRSSLLISLRNVLQMAAEKDINLLKRSLDILAEENYTIFKRLQLFMYKDHFSELKTEIEKSAIEYFDDVKFRHEYYLLLQSTFVRFTSTTKSQLLKLIDDGPNIDRLQISEEEIEAFKKRWKVDRLEPIIEHIPEKKIEYDQLVEEVGMSQLSSIAVVSSVSYQVEEPTDLTEQMTTDEVIAYVNEYSLKDGNFPEDDAAVKQFGELVANNSKDYSTQSSKLLPLHSIFYSEFFHALARTVREGNQINWNEVLQLCEQILNIDETEFSGSTQETILGHMSELIAVGLLDRRNSLPFANRRQVWVVLETIVSKCHGDGNWAKNYPAGNIDARMIAINSHTGQAIRAILQYSVWCYHKLKIEGKVNTELDPEVQALLELRLDPAIDDSISTHAVFGSHFHNFLALDKAWTCKNISRIFPRGKNSTLGDAAWESFIFQQPYLDVFVELKAEYEYRIKALQRDTEKYGARDPGIKLAEQMGLYYISGIQNADFLFDLFLKYSSSRLIGVCIKHIGWIFKNQSREPASSAYLQKLWDKREIMKRPEHGWLFSFSSLDKERNIKQLLKCLDLTLGKVEPLWEIFNELPKYSKSYPLETISSVQKIVNSNVDSPDFMLYETDLENIFIDVRSSNDSLAIDIMNSTLDRLGKAGFDNFRKFA